MTDSPLIKEIITETRQDSILRVLEVRFGAVPAKLTKLVRSVSRDRPLDALFDCSLVCPNLKAFRARLMLIRRPRRGRA